MLIHGDCLDVLPTLEAGSIDLCILDLPYGVTRNRWDTCVDLGRLWPELLRVGHERTPFIFTATQPFAATLIASQPRLFRYDLIWHKAVATGFLNAKVCPLRCHESVLVFYRRKPVYAPQMAHGKRVTGYERGKNCETTYSPHAKTRYKGGSERYPRSVLYFDAERRNGKVAAVHPTQKPVALIEYLVRTYTRAGATVLDPTCGVATTAVAATNTGRKWVCIAKDAQWHALAAKRIAEHLVAPQQGSLAI